jgi:hypothetical protein
MLQSEITGRYVVQDVKIPKAIVSGWEKEMREAGITKADLSRLTLLSASTIARAFNKRMGTPRTIELIGGQLVEKSVAK